MDFMEMREALNVAGCVAAKGNEEGFYGARPGAAGLLASATSGETHAQLAMRAASFGYDPRIAPLSTRKPG